MLTGKGIVLSSTLDGVACHTVSSGSWIGFHLSTSKGGRFR